MCHALAPRPADLDIERSTGNNCRESARTGFWDAIRSDAIRRHEWLTYKCPWCALNGVHMPVAKSVRRCCCLVVWLAVGEDHRLDSRTSFVSFDGVVERGSSTLVVDECFGTARRYDRRPEAVRVIEKGPYRPSSFPVSLVSVG
jgi:hypothetical protein